MDSIKANGWSIYTDIFKGQNIGEYIGKIKSAENITTENECLIKPEKFKHVIHGARALPLFHDIVNKVDYLALGFVYDTYGHLGFNRIEIRNKKAYIFIADQNYFKGKKGNIKVRIFNTFSIKHILAASFHLEDKKKFIINYDKNNVFYNDIIPVSSRFVIDAEISRETEYFQEEISFGDEVIKHKMEYNRLKIHRIRFNEKKCYGIAQGGEDHLFLYKISIGLEKNREKI
jgi:hypothetical protein